MFSEQKEQQKLYYDTYFLRLFSSSLSITIFFSEVCFERGGERSSRWLRRGERERDRLFRFLCGERDLLLLRCLRLSLSPPGILISSIKRYNSYYFSHSALPSKNPVKTKNVAFFLGSGKPIKEAAALYMITDVVLTNNDSSGLPSLLISWFVLLPISI